MKIQLTHPCTVREIAHVTGASPSPDLSWDAPVRSVATHSDEVEEATLFLALKGENTSGLRFHSEVLRRGGYTMAQEKTEKGLLVPSVIEALYRLADAHLRSFRRLRHTLCITGSVGKTTTKEILWHVLSGSLRLHATVGNQNSDIGLPLTVLAAPEDTELLLLEAGMNHKGELARISRLVHPSLAIITGIGHAHIGNLGSREAIAEAKKEILLGATADATVLIPQGEPLLDGIKGAKRVGTCGTGEYSLCRADGRLCLCTKGGARVFFPEKMQDSAMICDTAFAVAAALSLGLSPSLIEERISILKDNIFRQKTFCKNGTEIVFDAYNASFESVMNAIGQLCDKECETRALLLGDMQELGVHTDRLNRYVAEAIAERRKRISFLFLFGENADGIAAHACEAGFPSDRIFTNADADRPEASAADIRKVCREGTCLFIKGARGMRMERILDILIGEKGENADVR